MISSHASHHSYWNSFYHSPRGTSVVKDSSPFAQWLEPRLRHGQPLVELGFGTARDSLWFARRGHPVLAYDFAETAVSAATSQAKSEGLDQAAFNTLDLCDAEATGEAMREIRRLMPTPVLYGRFLLHSLEPQGRSSVLSMAAGTLADGGKLALEFRTAQDSDTRHLFGEDHFRAYLDPQEIVSGIEENGGQVEHCEAGRGMARYKDEDPHVARIIARW